MKSLIGDVRNYHEIKDDGGLNGGTVTARSAAIK